MAEGAPRARSSRTETVLWRCAAHAHPLLQVEVDRCAQGLRTCVMRSTQHAAPCPRRRLQRRRRRRRRRERRRRGRKRRGRRCGCGYQRLKGMRRHLATGHRVAQLGALAGVVFFEKQIIQQIHRDLVAVSSSQYDFHALSRQFAPDWAIQVDFQTSKLSRP